MIIINLFSLCLHRESLTCLCLSTKLENVTCSCQDTKIWLFVMFYPHLQVNMFQRLKVIFKAAAFLLGQTALIWSACVEVQSSQVLFTNVPKQEMMHWCFRANHPGTFLVSSVVLFLSSFSSFFCLFRCHLSSLPNLHFSCYLLHPHCSQRQRTLELHS